jgi:hypothetical protein
LAKSLSRLDVRIAAPQISRPPTAFPCVPQLPFGSSGQEICDQQILHSAFSRFFDRFLIDDTLARELEIPPHAGNLSEVIFLLYGRDVRISKSNCRFLEIRKLESAARGIQSKTGTTAELVKYSEQPLSCQRTDTLARIAANFDEFSAPPLVLSASVELLEHVLKRPSLSIAAPSSSRSSHAIAARTALLSGRSTSTTSPRSSGSSFSSPRNRP